MTAAARIVCLALALGAGAAQASAFGVSPIRLDLNADDRTGAITVSNDEARPLSFQIRLLRWTQDATGADRYEPSTDLVYFPRLMTLASGQKRVVRVGARGAAPQVEDAYRLVIEEIVPPADGTGPRIALRLSFALPVFVAPARPADAAQVEGLRVAGGELRLAVRNGGNRHVKLESMVLRRGDAAIGEASGWYVLPGARREFALPLPPRECGAAGARQLALMGEGFGGRGLLLDVPACTP